MRVVWVSSCSTPEPARERDVRRYEASTVPLYSAPPPDGGDTPRRQTKTARGTARGRIRAPTVACPATYIRHSNATTCTLDETIPAERPPKPSSEAILEAERRGSNQVGNLLQRGDCRGAQARFRELRAAGVEGSARDHFSADWCPCPE